jgi:hypothetical protein
MGLLSTSKLQVESVIAAERPGKSSIRHRPQRGSLAIRARRIRFEAPQEGHRWTSALVGSFGARLVIPSK